MAANQRKSLGDRNRNAIAATPPTDPDTPTHTKQTTPNNVLRVSVWIPEQLYTGMKAAFLTDWANHRQYPTFQQWLDNAVEAHLRRDLHRRPCPIIPDQAVPRVLLLSRNLVAQVEQTLEQEHQTRWLSKSAWLVEAFQQAVNTTEHANGYLPDPPARLPSKLQ